MYKQQCFLVLLIGLMILSACFKKSSSDSFPTNNVRTCNFSYTVDDRFHLFFDVINSSDSVRYVMTSEWFLYGNKSRFKINEGVPTENFEINGLIYCPLHPGFINPTPNSYAEVKPEFEYFPTFVRLEPNQFQRIQLIISKDITKSLKKIPNQFSFSASLFYLTEKVWEETRNQRIKYYDTNSNVLFPSSKTLCYRINQEEKLIHLSPEIIEHRKNPTPGGFRMTDSDYIITKFFLK